MDCIFYYVKNELIIPNIAIMSSNIVCNIINHVKTDYDLHTLRVIVNHMVLTLMLLDIYVDQDYTNHDIIHVCERDGVYMEYKKYSKSLYVIMKAHGRMFTLEFNSSVDVQCSRTIDALLSFIQSSDSIKFY